MSVVGEFIMINTSDLVEGEKVTVKFNNGNIVNCKYINGVFINVESNHHKGEIYGSSVASYKRCKL